jgi:hypothetical protein
MIVSSALTFAIWIWQRKSETLPPQTQAAQVRVAAPPEPIASLAPARQPDFADRAPLPAATAPKRPAAVIAAAEDGSEVSTLPLAFNVYNRRGRGKIEGFVKNISAQPLYVTLQVLDASGQPTAQQDLSLAPAEEKKFGTDSGLDIHSLDRVVFHSPPYKDSSIDVP